MEFPFSCLVLIILVALKSEALAWRFTDDPTDIQSTFERLDLVYTYHGRASGLFILGEKFVI